MSHNNNASNQHGAEKQLNSNHSNQHGADNNVYVVYVCIYCILDIVYISCTIISRGGSVSNPPHSLARGGPSLAAVTVLRSCAPFPHQHDQDNLIILIVINLDCDNQGFTLVLMVLILT